MEILVREAMDADRETLIEQLQLLNQFENTITKSTLTDRAAAEASYVSSIEYVTGNNGGGLLAEINGQVVGFLFFVVRDDDPYVREEFRRYGHVSELFVLEDFRGRGVARALMAGAERIAIARGARRMTIGVLVGNDAAYGAYVNFGFKPYHTRLSKTFE